MLSCLWDGAYKRSLVARRKSNPSSGDSGFPLSLSTWSFFICPMPNNRKIKCVKCDVKTFPSIFPSSGRVSTHGRPFKLFLVLTSAPRSYVLSYLWDGAYKISLAANRKIVAHVVAAAGLHLSYLNGPLPHITKMC